MRWTLTTDGHEHVVTISGSTLVRTIEWQIDDLIVATKSSPDDRVTLHEGGSAAEVGVRFGRWSTDARRVTLTPDGIDFVPEAGSAAERREMRIRRHPWRHTMLLTASGVLKVVVPILLGLIAIRFVFTLPWPSIPWPDWRLASIPWPSIPWPGIELPDLSLPDWIREALSKAKYVWPILLAFVLARAEVRRRRQQDALRNERESLDHSGPTTTTDLG